MGSPTEGIRGTSFARLTVVATAAVAVTALLVLAIPSALVVFDLVDLARPGGEGSVEAGHPLVEGRGAGLVLWIDALGLAVASLAVILFLYQVNRLARMVDHPQARPGGRLWWLFVPFATLFVAAGLFRRLLDPLPEKVRLLISLLPSLWWAAVVCSNATVGPGFSRDGDTFAYSRSAELWNYLPDLGAIALTGLLIVLTARNVTGLDPSVPVDGPLVPRPAAA